MNIVTIVLTCFKEGIHHKHQFFLLTSRNYQQKLKSRSYQQTSKFCNYQQTSNLIIISKN